MSLATTSPLKIAIVGGGPGGLGAAIALSKLQNVEVTIYEQARELKEIGAGLRIGYNGWKVLELLGVDGIKGHLKTEVIHRNGLNGNVLRITRPSISLPAQHRPHRVRRTRLQRALLNHVPVGAIKLQKKLASIDNLQDEGIVQLTFEDGTKTIAHLVVGADGIRSVVRHHVFPEHGVKFTGTTIWRVLIPRKSVTHIPDVSTSTSWWHGPAGHAYMSPVDDKSEKSLDEEQFEVSVRYLVNPATDREQRSSHGIPATNNRVEKHFSRYDSRVQEVLKSVPEGSWREFAAFAGPRLDTIIAWDKIALVGDASHPLSGAFGSGAAFALEDGWILARAIEYCQASTQISRKALADALAIFDSIRSPYYWEMYRHLDAQKLKTQEMNTKQTTFKSLLEKKVKSFDDGQEMSWIYDNDIEEVWKSWVEKNTKKQDAELGNIARL